MQKQQVKFVDFRQEGSSDLILPKPAILSSRNSNWTDIHFEYHQQPGYDTTEYRVPTHVISTVLGSIYTERWLDGRFQREFQNREDTNIIPAYTLHRVQWQQEGQFMFVAIEPSLLRQVGEDLLNPDKIELIPHFATVRDPLIQGILFALKRELESGGICGNLYIDHLKVALAIHMLRWYCTSTPKITNYSNGLSRQKLQKVIEYINARLAEKIQLTALAKVVDISQYYFCSLFKQSMGISPYQYIIGQRIERAKQLLKQKELSIVDVALKCGFSSQTHFSKQFRKRVGITPFAYRKR